MPAYTNNPQSSDEMSDPNLTSAFDALDENLRRSQSSSPFATLSPEQMQAIRFSSAAGDPGQIRSSSSMQHSYVSAGTTIGGSGAIGERGRFGDYPIPSLNWDGRTITTDSIIQDMGRPISQPKEKESSFQLCDDAGTLWDKKPCI